MEMAVASRLLELNRRFYAEHGGDFSATRRRLQPGVLRVIESWRGDETILDLGCGNGELARALSRRGHRGSYLGLDSSLPLLREAERGPFHFPVHFLQADLIALPQTDERWSCVSAFAVLHHVPGLALRLRMLEAARARLADGGSFVLSNWQFLTSPRLKARIQSWDVVGLRQQDVDAGDALLDWRLGGGGLRYVHAFDETELAELARAAHFEIFDSFYSDGENNRLSLYQIWKGAG